MKTEETIIGYTEMIQQANQKLIESNLTEDLGSLFLQIDLYNHFKELRLGRPHNFDIDLFPYYNSKEGWKVD